jgi:pimeloyl-ACP methyl ester carboxylesterase
MRVRAIIGRSVAGLLLLVLLLAGVGLCYRAFLQHRAAQLIAIHSPAGIDEASFVRIGGQDQWITIRGQDRAKPVLLILHGGPGDAESLNILRFAYLEKDFVVAQWDQPGAGHTFGRTTGELDPSLTIDKVVADGIEVADYLRHHLHKPKLVLLGHSWGSMLGVKMAKARPDLFYAYVGTGQVVDNRKGDVLAYSQLFAAARARGNGQAVTELVRSGAPPYSDYRQFLMARKWAMVFESDGPSRMDELAAPLLEPRARLIDAWNWMGGFMASQAHFFHGRMDGSFMKVDLTTLGPDFAVPMFVFQGEEDNFTPAAIAAAYLQSIRAPRKAFVMIKGAGHMAITAHPVEFLGLLRRYVLPLTTDGGANILSKVSTFNNSYASAQG